MTRSLRYRACASLAAAGLVVALVLGAAASAGAVPAPWDPGRGLLIAGATVVTMDEQHTVIPHGNVLVRDGKIVAVWAGPQPPDGVVVGDASVIRGGPQELLFPGLINLHDHPSFDALDPWLPPASDALPALGKAGTDPYANRYQWGAAGSPISSLEKRRLITNPANVLNSSLGLGLAREVNRYAQTAGLLGGETTLEGGDGDVIHRVEDDPQVAPSYVGAIAALDGAPLANLRAGLADGRYDVWILHLAEGVHDGDRRPGDPFSSRGEFQTLKAKGLLSDATVIIHGTGLKRSDFAEMRAAPSLGPAGSGDGLGAKLVWSPLSNLLLYGKTTNVYDAFAEGVLVSLGTDWAPSGSRTLLDELKVADVAMRDQRILGGSRDEVPSLAVDGKQGLKRQQAEEALDRALVDMVTRNPALTLREYDQAGSIDPGKRADLLLVHRPQQAPALGMPPSVYRDLIDATEREVELVLVGGEPRGDPDLLSALKPGDEETVACTAGGYQKGVDITSTTSDPVTSETLAQTTGELSAGLSAIGGDQPPAGGADLDPTIGLIADPDPPYRLYPADLNFVGPAGNPLAVLP